MNLSFDMRFIWTIFRKSDKTQFNRTLNVLEYSFCSTRRVKNMSETSGHDEIRFCFQKKYIRLVNQPLLVTAFIFYKQLLKAII